VVLLSLIEHCTCVVDWWSVASVPNVSLSPAHSPRRCVWYSEEGSGQRTVERFGLWSRARCKRSLEFDVSSDTFQFLNSTVDRLLSLSLDALALCGCSRLKLSVYRFCALSLEF